MLRRDPRGDAVGPAKDDRAGHLPARHVARLGRRIDDLVDRLHREVEGHELDDRPQPGKAGADPDPGEALLGDRRVDDPPGAEFLQQALADLVGALIFGDLLAHQEHGVVAPHLFGDGVAQRLAHGDRRRGALVLRLGPGCGRGRRRRRRRRWGQRLGGRWCFCRGRRRLDSGGADVFAVAGDDRDLGVDRDVLGALRDHDLGEDALVDRLDLHRRLVGLDFRQHVAGRDMIALRLDPARNLAFGHRRRQRRHQDIGAHRCSLGFGQHVRPQLARIGFRAFLGELRRLGDDLARPALDILELGVVGHVLRQ